ncbi:MULTISPECIES: acyltransferase [Pseudomonas]|uniref:Acyltransferase n=1 Tax=Pseudomonas benzopyrenica TaxID=2993566 RepID=A0ABZ2FQY9_9PSED|nr:MULTISPECIES: acyltransferase [Pseudomonas]MDC7831081.1 acyltransferase [Pseudomonas benzopyrenica]MXS20835.1 acyltransferase family protein [Pseudomonas oryzihabitans]SEP36037.1 Peptidoglycan/LPS O-acetylase OafA/YrhL, contains acyltransferase and SGNH-hydrolase domains [Pseudomonas sp. Snoq117.2]
MTTAHVPQGRNNFDFLRFAAASTVVIGHGFWLSGHIGAEPILNFTGFTDAANIAVYVFFVISGFLITASFQRSRNPLDFLAKRALRIFPALIVSVLFSVLVVGWLATSRETSAYFSDRQTLGFFKNILLMTRFELPGVFTGNPFPDTVNGSYWTLPYEVFMYLSLLIIGVLGLLTRSVVMATLVVLVVGNFLLLPQMGIASFVLHKVFSLGMFFFAGALLQLAGPRIPWRLDLALALCLLSLAAIVWHVLPVIHLVSLAYVIIYLAQVQVPVLHGFGRFGDYSYGLYLFNFPVQQLLMHWFPDSFSLPGFLVVSYVLTLGLAVLSWHLIEAPALKFKPRRQAPTAPVAPA